MWLKISFFPDKPKLLAALGQDGIVYFRAFDVGRLLGYTSPRNFAIKYAVTNLKDKVPQCLLSWSTQKEGGVLVFEFEEMMEKIKKVIHRRRKHLDEKHVWYMRSLWHFGCVSKKFPLSVPHFPIRAFPLKIETVDEILFQEWIYGFAEMMRIFFHAVECKLSNDPHFIDVESLVRNLSLRSNAETFENKSDEIRIEEDVDNPDAYTETLKNQHLNVETRIMMDVDNPDDSNKTFENRHLNEKSRIMKDVNNPDDSNETFKNQNLNEKTRIMENVDVPDYLESSECNEMFENQHLNECRYLKFYSALSRVRQLEQLRLEY